MVVVFGMALKISLCHDNQAKVCSQDIVFMPGSKTCLGSYCWSDAIQYHYKIPGIVMAAKGQKPNIAGALDLCHFCTCNIWFSTFCTLDIFWVV